MFLVYSVILKSIRNAPIKCLLSMLHCVPHHTPPYDKTFVLISKTGRSMFHILNRNRTLTYLMKNSNEVFLQHSMSINGMCYIFEWDSNIPSPMLKKNVLASWVLQRGKLHHQYQSQRGDCNLRWAILTSLIKSVMS